MIYIALLRGINVGGKNIIKMQDLRDCFERNNFTAVQTYIQSGNVIFTTKERSTAKLEETIQSMLQKQFGYQGNVMVVSATNLQKVITEAPKQFGKEPDTYRYDVIFFKAPYSPKKVIDAIPKRDEVDELTAGKHAVYASRPIALATKSKLSQLTTTPFYQFLTIRNWNTTSKLYELTRQ